MNRFHDFGRGGAAFGGRWGGFHPPQLAADQQAARRAIETAQEQLDAQLHAYESQFRSWRAQVDAAAQSGTTTMPSLPTVPSTALTTAYAALVQAENQSKAADAAAAAPPTVTAATVAAGSGGA